ncbi:MAG: division/cell wall cluster transcriptional repressor MraZ [Candidatus Marinimicrobia bacterium]|nr:division/cell wall cluster transcriptional repressor MraZ [Candidatus Neomarinimicrobiota bacterium]
MGTKTFTGEFRYSIDAKGRVNVPSKFRKALPETSEDTFVVTRGLDENIVAYSLDKWQQIEEELLKLSSRLPGHRAYKRQATRFATSLKFDSQGRVAIPVNLLQHAGIDKDVVIIGMIDEIEIWDPEILKRYEDTVFQLDAEDIEAIDNYTRSP